MEVRTKLWLRVGHFRFPLSRDYVIYRIREAYPVVRRVVEDVQG